jgi:hypothetical protein
MNKLMTISALAAVLSVAIATNASAFPRRGLAFAHGGAAAFHSGGVWRGAGWRGGGVAVGAAGGFAVGTVAGAAVALPYGPYVATAPVYVSPPSAYAEDAVIGGADGHGRAAFVGGAGRFVSAGAGHFVGAGGARLRR